MNIFILFYLFSAMLYTKTLRVTPSNAQVRLKKERWLEIGSRTDGIDMPSRYVFLAKLAQFIFMFCYVFIRFYVNIMFLLCLLTKFFNVEKKQKDELMQRV